jgi:hypothetical protein
MKTTIVLMSSMLLASCGVFEKTKKEAKKVAKSDPALVGTWNTDCIDTSVLELTHGQKEVIFDLKGTFTKKEYLFDDEGCQNKAAVYEVDGDYKDQGKNKDNGDVKDIDFKMTEAHFTAYSETLVKAMNLTKFCGISDWKKGAKRDIMGEECIGYPVPEKGDDVYDVYRVEDKELFFGGNFLFLSDLEPTERPEDIDPNLAYDKK